jgi:hypothetical protein
LAATASRGNGSRYRRALAAGIAHLDLQDPDQCHLLRRFGPFSTDLRVWVQDDPVPVACLAVVAGLLLLQPKQRRQPMPIGADERTPSWYPARTDPGRPRTRSLEELCISLT